MCGRFSLSANIAALQKNFPWFAFPQDLVPRFNIAPTQPVAVVPNDGNNKVEMYTWGLIPYWAKDAAIGSRMINARAETLAEKPSFRAAYKRRRCLILADGFFEWRRQPGSQSKTPVYINLVGNQPFVFAGLWESWKNRDDSVIRSCTIITTEPNQLISEIHNRMPVILPKEDYQAWLDPGEAEPARLNQLLKPYTAELMVAHAVSKIVTNPSIDTPECIQPV